MGWICSASLGRKREMTMRRPIRRWTSDIVVVRRSNYHHLTLATSVLPS